MFDFIRRMFGKGKIRASFICIDGTTGTVKIPYIGDISTLDEQELTQRIRREVLVEYGKVVIKVNIVGWT